MLLQLVSHSTQVTSWLMLLWGVCCHAGFTSLICKAINTPHKTTLTLTARTHTHTQTQVYIHEQWWMRIKKTTMESSSSNTSHAHSQAEGRMKSKETSRWKTVGLWRAQWKCARVSQLLRPPAVDVCPLASSHMLQQRARKPDVRWI